MKPSALPANSVAVITGGASGIGLAAAGDAERLAEAAGQIAADPDRIMTSETDVSRAGDLQRLEAAVKARFGGTDILMNNAGIQPGSGVFGPAENWRRVIDVNLWGIIEGTQIFAPGMIARGRPGLIINTGSKQGITTPPGDPAYNVAKAGVKAFTEALQHELRNTPDCELSAHLLIPGFVFTGLTAYGRAEKPDAAWTPEQTVDFMMERLEQEDFYILCPDNDVPRALDERRIAWAAGDIIENRPPLSRWHPDWKDAFARYIGDRL
jgi:NAD(P)-dependent dehydrogenase (short-subunit alcohol dehydrogenase family)